MIIIMFTHKKDTLNSPQHAPEYDDTLEYEAEGVEGYPDCVTQPGEHSQLCFVDAQEVERVPRGGEEGTVFTNYVSRF